MFRAGNLKSGGPGRLFRPPNLFFLSSPRFIPDKTDHASVLSKRLYFGIRVRLAACGCLFSLCLSASRGQAGEVMRDFFDRTKLFWTTEIVRRREESEEPVEHMTEKVLDAKDRICANQCALQNLLV